MSKAITAGGKSVAGTGFRRNLVVLALAILWAAAHQPDRLDMPDLLIWVLTILTVALLIRAGLAIVEPAFTLAVTLAWRHPSTPTPPKDSA
ncbi:hypothetical protein [Acidisoma silvae]|uniref:Uncharacterized protein n=1 Tax=Acidisoma silvae TaxID=2802396 RepID=A0A964DY58_9PROT|nr:hypothetical protein [Acidisoma silvae]MCB8874921.1 hypothetical protein [Acidisoma silvae]